MTEKEILTIQNDLYWNIKKIFGQQGVPPILQKILIEGIYSRFQTEASSYDWDLYIQSYAEREKEKAKEEIEQRGDGILPTPSSNKISEKGGEKVNEQN